MAEAVGGGLADRPLVTAQPDRLIEVADALVATLGDVDDGWLSVVGTLGAEGAR